MNPPLQRRKGSQSGFEFLNVIKLTCTRTTSFLPCSKLVLFFLNCLLHILFPSPPAPPANVTTSASGANVLPIVFLVRERRKRGQFALNAHFKAPLCSTLTCSNYARSDPKMVYSMGLRHSEVGFRPSKLTITFPTVDYPSLRNS